MLLYEQSHRALVILLRGESKSIANMLETCNIDIALTRLSRVSECCLMELQFESVELSTHRCHFASTRSLSKGASKKHVQINNVSIGVYPHPFCWVLLQPFSVACGIGLNEFWMWRMSESGK